MKQNSHNILFERTSWGKKQLKQEFDLDVVKANLSSVDAAKALYEKYSAEVGFIASRSVVNTIINNASTIQSTYGYTGYIYMLHVVWTEHGSQLEFNGAEGEFTFAKRLLNNLKKQCAEGTVIGKKKVIEQTLRLSLELLEHV